MQVRGALGCPSCDASASVAAAGQCAAVPGVAGVKAAAGRPNRRRTGFDLRWLAIGRAVAKVSEPANGRRGGPSSSIASDAGLTRNVACYRHRHRPRYAAEKSIFRRRNYLSCNNHGVTLRCGAPGRKLTYGAKTRTCPNLFCRLRCRCRCCLAIIHGARAPGGGYELRA